MSLLVWMPLTNGIENQGLVDIGTPSYQNITADANGKIGGCYKGQGLVYHFDKQLLQDKWTIAMWVKCSEFDIYNNILFCQNTTAVDSSIYLSILSNTRINLGINGNSESAGYYTYTFATDTWYHIAVTYNKPNYVIYLNGSQVKTGTRNVTSYTGHNNIGFGCRSTNAAGTTQTGANNYKFYNDFRLYDTALSPREIKEIAKGLVLHYPLSGIGNPNLLPCGMQYTSSSPWTSTLERADGYTWVTNSAFEAKPSTTYTISVQCDGTLSSLHSMGSLTPQDKPWTLWLYICNTDTTKSWQTGQYDTAINLHRLNNNYRKIGNVHIWTYTTSSTQKYISLRTNSYSDGTTPVTVNWWNMKVEEGSEPTPWIPYYVGNNNLIPHVSKETSYIKANDDGMTFSAVNASSDPRAWGLNNSQHKVHLFPGTYTCTIWIDETTTATNRAAHIYKSSGLIQNSLVDFTKQGPNSYTFTLNEQDDIGIEIKIYTGKYHIKLEKGDKSTPWTPYNLGNDNLYIKTANVFDSNGSRLSTTTINNGLISDNNAPGGKYRSWTVVPDSGAQNRGVYYVASYIGGVENLVPNQIYAISFYAKSSINSKMYVLGVCESQTLITHNGNNDNYFYLTPQWQRFYVTFQWTSTAKFTTCFYINVTGLTENVVMDIALPKVERGYDATPWSPNKTDAEWKSLGYDILYKEYVSMSIEDNIEYDVSGNKNNGIRNGSITYTTNSARYIMCSRFIDQTATLQAPLIISPTEITMSVWVKGTAIGGSSYHQPLNIDGARYELSIDSSGKFRNGFYVDGTRKVTTTNSINVLDGNWHLLVATFDGSTIKRYVDGVLVNSTDAPGALPTTVNLYIGKHGATEARYYNNELCENDVRIYATALSADDILELYHTPITLSANGTLLTQGEYVES